MNSRILNSEQRELGASVLTIIANRVPGVDIPFEFFQYRNRIKQNRINKFIEILQEYLETSGLNKRIDFDLINEEDFTDILEAVLNRVSRTRSMEKLDRFKLIVAKSLIVSNSINYLETFLDIIAELHEKEIEILQKHYEIFKQLSRESLITENNSIKIQLKKENEKEFNNEPNVHKELRKRLNEMEKFRKGGAYNISEAEYKFFIQDLSSKSLLVDFGIGGIGVDSYDLMEVTEFGKEFLTFIEKI